MLEYSHLDGYTIIGDYGTLFKCLIELQRDRHISDREYFLAYTKAHLDRSGRLLDQEKKHSRDLLIHLTEQDKSI